MNFELIVMIASVIFTLFILTILLLQKKGFFKKKTFTILMLCASVIFIFASVFFFYTEYSSYNNRKKSYPKNFGFNKNYNETSFTNAEFNVLEEFVQAKNSLIGYETSLKESAKNFDPNSFSYENLLKEKIILEFKRKENSLEYWQEVEYVINHLYLDTIKNNWNTFPVKLIPNDTYKPISFDKGTDNKNIELTSKLEYIKRKIKSFGRSTENIEGLWVNNKVFIYTIISKSKYNKIAKTIENLISVYNIITKEEGYKEFYANHNYYTKEGYHDDEFSSYPSKEIVDYYNNNWLFGFWDRRFEENNDKIVYEKLKEIQSHYKD